MDRCSTAIAVKKCGRSAGVIQPSVEARTFFNEEIAKHCGGDKKKAESVPHQALVQAILGIQSRDEAERFLSGHLHWLQGRYPRTVEAAMSAAKANVSWCFEEGMKPAQMEMWKSLWVDPVLPASTKTPEEAFRAAQAVGAKIVAGKNPGLVAALAKKALQKKAKV